MFSRGLSNLQIEKVLFRHKKLSKFFKGCFPADLIPQNLNPPFAIIVNFDKSGQKGEHWISIVAQSWNTIEYMDSFGREPPFGPINDFVDKFKNKIINRTSFQNPLSTVCGQYAVYYLVERFLNNSPSMILQRLVKSKNSDKFVGEYFLKLARY